MSKANRSPKACKNAHIWTVSYIGFRKGTSRNAERSGCGEEWATVHTGWSIGRGLCPFLEIFGISFLKTLHCGAFLCAFEPSLNL